MRRFRVLLVAIATVATGRAQTIPVAGGGAALAQAVAQAPDGAVLVVANGSYLPFTAPNRHLTIVAPQRATIEDLSGNGQHLWLTGISAARPIRLVGFDVRSAYSQFPPGYVRGRVSGGNLHLENVSCENLLSVTGSVILVSDSVITASDSSAVSVQHGALVLVDSAFHGGIFPGNPWAPSAAVSAIGFAGSTLRAERIVATTRVHAGASAPPLWLGSGSAAVAATIASSSLQPGAAGTPAIQCTANTSLSLSGNQLGGGVTCAATAATLTTLQWGQRQWSPGGAATFAVRAMPNVLALAAIAFDAVPFATPLAAELPFVGAMPTAFLWSAGVTDAQGGWQFAVPLPNTPSALYADLWLTAASGATLPMHVSTPLGGVVR